MKRLSQAQLVLMAEAMPERRRLILDTVLALRLVSGQQLRRLCFATDAGGRPESIARLARMELASLVQARVLHRLERRVGGVRSGSEGHVYALGPVGYRLAEYFAGHGLPRTRSRHEPGTPFIAHTLAVSEIYTGLHEADYSGTAELLEFVSEPGSWRRYIGPVGREEILKPDGYVRLGIGPDEALWFIEVDQATERRGALQRKHQAYLNYYRSGREQTRHGVFPRVLWIVPDLRRRRELDRISAGLGPDAQTIFLTTTFDQAIAALTASENDTTGAAP